MAKHNRDLGYQAYLHCLAFALIALGLISLGAFLANASPARHELVLLPDSALITLFAGIALLGATRSLHRISLLAGLALIALAGYSLGHNVLAGGSDQGRSLVSGYFRIRSELAIVACLFGLAMLLAVTRQGGDGSARSAACPCSAWRCSRNSPCWEQSMACRASPSGRNPGTSPICSSPCLVPRC